MVYAKILNGEVVEYPVLPQHLKTRGHRPDMYEPVKLVSIPKHDENVFNLSEVKPRFLDGELTQVYKLLPCVPKKLTVRQARQQLIMDGLLSQVQAAIDAIEDPVEREITQNYWEYAAEFERNNPVLLRLAGQLGLTDAELDRLFVEGYEL